MQSLYPSLVYRYNWDRYLHGWPSTADQDLKHSNRIVHWKRVTVSTAYGLFHSWLLYLPAGHDLPFRPAFARFHKMHPLLYCWDIPWKGYWSFFHPPVFASVLHNQHFPSNYYTGRYS